MKCSHWVSSQVLANSLETNASSASGHCSKADIGEERERESSYHQLAALVIAIISWILLKINL